MSPISAIEIESYSAYAPGRGEAVEGIAKRLAQIALGRRCEQAARRIVSAASDKSVTSEELAQFSQSEILRATTESKQTGPVAADKLADEYWADLEARLSRGQVSGLSTGLKDVDRFARLEKGKLWILAGRPGMGKAQPLDSKVLTPSGWVRIGDLSVGDTITGSNGKPCRVTGVFPRGKLEVFRVTFTDGASTLCCDDHLWLTETRSESRKNLGPSVKSLREIRNSLFVKAEPLRKNHRVQLVQPVEFAPGAPLPLHPYVLGVLLGDGSTSGNCARIHNTERDIVERVGSLLPAGDSITERSTGKDWGIIGRKHGVASVTSKLLAGLGLLGADCFTKFIPQSYLLASVEDRVSLLQGLIDTDGFVPAGGRTTEYSTSSARLADDVVSLARSLGMLVRKECRVPTFSHRGERKKGALSYRIYIQSKHGITPCASTKHTAKWNSNSRATSFRSFESVEFAGEMECVCISVDAPDRLYVTDDYIVTHNSALAGHLALSVARQGASVLVFSLEMPRLEWIERLACSLSGVNSRAIREAKINQADMTKLSEAINSISQLPILIDDTEELSLWQLRSRAIATKAAIAAKALRGDLGLVVVDYLQLVRASLDRSDSSREQEVAEISRASKALSKQLGCTVLQLAQLNRKCEERSDKRPMLSDLRESGAIEQDADAVVFIYRDEVYNKDSRDKGVAEVLFAKQRGGETGPVRVAFDASRTRFSDLEETSEPRQYRNAPVVPAYQEPDDVAF